MDSRYVFDVLNAFSPLQKEALRRTFESVNTSLPGNAELWEAVARARAGGRVEATLEELRAALDGLSDNEWEALNTAASLLARGNAFDALSEPRLVAAVHVVMDATYPGTVLDVGCWKGDFARMLRDLSYHVTGTDLAHMPEADDNMNLFCHGWAHEVLRRWPAESFDVVTCLETLEHIPTRHLRLTCREMVRVAQRGVLVEVPGWDDGAVTHLRVFTLDALKDLFQDCSAEVLVAPNSAEYTTVWFRRKG